MMDGLLVGGEMFVVDVEVIEQPFEFEFLENDANAADDAGLISDDMVTC